MHDHDQYRALAAAVFRQAAYDATHRVEPEHTASACQFLVSTGEALEFWAHVAHVRPELVRMAARRRLRTKWK